MGFPNSVYTIVILNHLGANIYIYTHIFLNFIPALGPTSMYKDVVLHV